VWSASGSRRARGQPARTHTLSAEAAFTATFLHAGFDAGPVIFTDGAGKLIEERRYEPFGVPIDARFADDTVRPPDVAARDLNPLAKRTEPATGWSDHGARWLAPEAARWLAPDPAIAVPDPKFMDAPWALHPYQYVDQNPVTFWDPDGRAPAINQVASTPPPARSMGSRVMSIGVALQEQGRASGERVLNVLDRGWDIVAQSQTSPAQGSKTRYDYDLVVQGNTKDVVDQILRLAADAPIRRLLIDDHGGPGVQTFGPDSIFRAYALTEDHPIHPELLRLAGKFAPGGILVLHGCNFADVDNDNERQRLFSGMQYLSSTLGVEVRAAERQHRAAEGTLDYQSVTSCRGGQCVTALGENNIEQAWRDRAENGH